MRPPSGVVLVVLMHVSGTSNDNFAAAGDWVAMVLRARSFPGAVRSSKTTYTVHAVSCFLFPCALYLFFISFQLFPFLIFLVTCAVALNRTRVACAARISFASHFAFVVLRRASPTRVSSVGNTTPSSLSRPLTENASFYLNTTINARHRTYASLLFLFRFSAGSSPASLDFISLRSTHESAPFHAG